jgi:hypothetical protein
MNSNESEAGSTDNDMQPEYDFSGRTGVRGKYYQKLRQGYAIQVQREDGTTLVQHVTRPEGTVTLDPDVREYFPDAESVNTALRTLIHLVPQKKNKRTTTTESAGAKSSIE